MSCRHSYWAAEHFKRNPLVLDPTPMRRIQANTDIAAWRIVDGEAVIVHADTSAYYGLNATATFIWESILTEALTTREIAERLGGKFGVASDLIQPDVESFLAGMEQEGLIQAGVGNGSAAPEGAGVAKGAGGTYSPPQLERFGELEQLVLSGE